MLVGVFSVASAAVGGLLSAFATWVSHRNREMKRSLKVAQTQHLAFHELENLYIGELASQGDTRPARTIKIEMRDRVQANGLPRPQAPKGDRP